VGGRDDADRGRVWFRYDGPGEYRKTPRRLISTVRHQSAASAY
jgi:hypothetical protein